MVWKNHMDIGGRERDWRTTITSVKKKTEKNAFADYNLRNPYRFIESPLGPTSYSLNNLIAENDYKLINCSIAQTLERVSLTESPGQRHWVRKGGSTQTTQKYTFDYFFLRCTILPFETPTRGTKNKRWKRIKQTKISVLHEPTRNNRTADYWSIRYYDYIMNTLHTGQLLLYRNYSCDKIVWNQMVKLNNKIILTH